MKDVIDVIGGKMVSETRNKWLVLIHQIPPKPDALRVKIWRRLQQIGAVAIKQSVYVLPFSEQSREDFSWTLKEIVHGGGVGSISELRVIEGLTDAQVITQFQNARKSDYEKIVKDANHLLAKWSSGKIDPKDPAERATAQVEKLQRQLDSVSAIDFFRTPEQGAAKRLLRGLAARLSGDVADTDALADGLVAMKGKIWVTRKNLFVDRIACGWLIKRFIDDTALFEYIDSDTYTNRPGKIRFDMFEGEYTHEGDRCTFEVMIKRLGLKDYALTAIAEVIHDIDLKERKYNRGETDGLNAMLTGLVTAEPDDEKRMARGAQLLDNLYTFFKGSNGRF